MINTYYKLKKIYVQQSIKVYYRNKRQYCLLGEATFLPIKTVSHIVARVGFKFVVSGDRGDS